MAEHSEAVKLTHGKMLLLFLCLGLVTSGKSEINITCEKKLVVEGQNHNLTCKVDCSDADKNNMGCETELYFWKHKSNPIRSCECVKHCNTMMTYFCEIKNVTKADEGNYTFTINTTCGNGNGSLNVSVTLRDPFVGSSGHLLSVSSLFWVFYCFSSLLVLSED